MVFLIFIIVVAVFLVYVVIRQSGKGGRYT